MPPAIYEFGKFRLYIKKKQLFRHDGQLVPLAPRPFELLLFLIENKGTIFSNDELLDKVWGKDISVEKGNVTQNISTINIALEDQKVPHEFIVNVHKRGYYFNEDAVRVIEDNDLEDYLKKEHFLSENESIQDGREVSQSGLRIAGQNYRESGLITTENKSSSDKEKKDREPAATSDNYQKKQRDSDKFNKWLFDYDNSLTRVAIACFVVTLVSGLFISIFIPRFSLTIVSGIQAAIIFVAALFPIRFREGFETTRESEEFWNSLSEKEKKATGCNSYKGWKNSSEIAENELGRYKRRWKWILLSWAALYGCLVIIGIPELTLDYLHANPDEIVKKLFIALSIFNTFLNNCSTGTIFICSNILTSPTKLGENNRPKNPDVLEKVILVTVVFTLIEIIYTWVYFAGVSDELQQIVGILKFFSGVSGIAAAAVYAQYFGRLQSKLLNPPSWLINLLFIYMAIQSLFLFLDIGTWGIVLIVAALFFKSLLFLYMTFLYQSGRLFFYLMRIRKTYENVEDEFDTFSSLLNKKN